MPAFHLLRCMIALGGDDDNVVYRDRSRPIVFPELPILQFIHGENAVTEVHVVGTWETNNDEVLQRLGELYTPEVVERVYPGVRPRLPLSDPSIPPCTLKVYRPRPVEPDNPDPRLKSLDQFTMPQDAVLSPVPAPEDDPTADEIAAHAQEDEDEVDLGLVPDQVLMPRPEDLPHVVRDTLGRGSSRRARGERSPVSLPDVNAGGSHPPDHRQSYGG